MHVLRARIGRIDPSGGGTGVPIVNRRVVLHARIAAEIGALGDHPEQVMRFVSFTDLSRSYITRLPLTILLYRLHELIRDADRIIGILKKDAAIGRPVQTGVVAG